MTNTDQNKNPYDRLRYVTFGVIAATIYLFVIRSYGTAVVDMFDSYVAVQITHILAFCASSTYVVFFYLFYNDYAGTSRPMLRTAALGAFIGAGLLLILHLRNLCLVFEIYDIPVMMDLAYVDILFPFVHAIAIAIFFTVFRKDTKARQQSDLKTPVLAGLIGASIQLCLVLLMTTNYLAIDQGFVLPDTHRVIGIFLVPILILQFMTFLYFYTSFHRHLKHHKPKTEIYNPIIEE